MHLHTAAHIRSPNLNHGLFLPYKLTGSWLYHQISVDIWSSIIIQCSLLSSSFLKKKKKKEKKRKEKNTFLGGSSYQHTEKHILWLRYLRFECIFKINIVSESRYALNIYDVKYIVFSLDRKTSENIEFEPALYIL